MITFLSSPKPFVGIDETNQLAAIRSWSKVHPQAEIILYGDCPGTEEACASVGATYVPDIECSPSGVPYFNAIVDHARQHAAHDLQVYLNCDILLNTTILRAARRVDFPEFLLIGQRIDLGENVRPDVYSPQLADELRGLFNRGQATLHPPSGVDYFAFRRGMWRELAPLVIGRAGYDSALVAYCLRRSIPVIDATCSVVALHQCHDYGHVKGGKKKVWEGEDARLNMDLHRVRRGPPNTADADWWLDCDGLSKKPVTFDMPRTLESWLRFKSGKRLLSFGVRGASRVLQKFQVYTPATRSPDDVLRQLQRELRQDGA